VNPAKTAEPIEMQFERWQTRIGPRDRVLDVCTYERHLANTIERCTLDGDLLQLVVVAAANCFSELLDAAR